MLNRPNCLLLLLLFCASFFSAEAQSVILGPAVRRPVLNGTYTLSRNSATGFLELTPKTGPGFLVAVDSSQVRGWTGYTALVRSQFTTTNQVLANLNTALSGKASTADVASLSVLTTQAVATLNQTNIAASSNFGFLDNRISVAIDTLNTKASRAEVSRILSGTAAADQSAYSRTATDFLLGQKASMVETAASLQQKATVAGISAIRSLTTTGPAAFVVNGGTYTKDPGDNTTVDNTGTVLVTAFGERYKRPAGRELNVMEFGATGNGSTDDRIAIQTAINLAKTFSAVGGGTFRANVIVPPAFYAIGPPGIDMTDANGIFLKGASGRYINTGFIGKTGGVLVDLSGTTYGGMDGISLYSFAGDNPSTTGVLLALNQDAGGNQKGGLNTVVNNFYIALADAPAANGGLGSIGIANIRSEEWGASDGTIIANVGLLCSNQANLTPVGATSFTVTSPFTTIAADAATGSMGVSTLSNISIQNIQKRSPAIVLLNANSFFFTGYLSRTGALTQGSEERAILAAGSCSNIHVRGTVESFSQLLRVPSALETGVFDLISANVTNSAKPLIDITGASLVHGVRFSVGMTNTPERAGRYLLWHDANSNGTEPITTNLNNIHLICHHLQNNSFAMPGWLSKRASNLILDSSFPVEKKGSGWQVNATKNVSMGTAGAVTAGAVLTFAEAAENTGENGKSGGYTITVEGQIQVGAHYIGAGATMGFRATITQNQTNFGVKDTPAYTVTLLDQSSTNTASVNITGITASLSFSGGMGTLSLTPTVTGTGTGADYPVTYSGQAGIRAYFHAQDTIPLN